MKKALFIEEFESIIKDRSKGNTAGINSTMFSAYCRSKEKGKERLDFDDIIFDSDIEPIAESARRFGLKEFTISVRQGNLTDILAAFQELGIFIKGTIQIKSRYTEHNVISAILMELA
ncbi:MAG: hypothetical protein IJU48_07500 [Synergistaceae bacterium]|nr:hypothetical protein [Synergistaceae bacterium]